MSNTPFDRLSLDGNAVRGPKMQHRGSLSEEENFEEWVLDYLLDRYGLADTRTKFMLMDEEKPYRDEYAPPHATNRAFQTFFPDFPIQLRTAWLSPHDRKRLTIPRLLLEPDKIFALNDFWRIPEVFTLEAHNRFATVLGGLKPKMCIADTPVFHNFMPLNANSPGYHYVFTTKSGWQVGIERLGSLFDEVDREFPPREWLSTASRTDFDTPRH